MFIEQHECSTSKCENVDARGKPSTMVSARRACRDSLDDAKLNFPNALFCAWMRISRFHFLHLFHKKNMIFPHLNLIICETQFKHWFLPSNVRFSRKPHQTLILHAKFMDWHNFPTFHLHDPDFDPPRNFDTEIVGSSRFENLNPHYFNSVLAWPYLDWLGESTECCQNVTDFTTVFRSHHPPRLPQRKGSREQYYL